MEIRAPRLPAPVPLGLSLAIGLTVLGVAVVLAPEAAPVLALGLTALLALVLIASASGVGPVARFAALLVLSISALGTDEGADGLEILFGLALVAYVLSWYAATFLSGRRFLRDGADVALLGFLVACGIGGLLLTLLQGISGLDVRADLLSLLALSLFFPARELCVRMERGPEFLALSILGLGLVAALIAAVQLQNSFADATVYYEIVDARVSSGEVQTMTALIVSLIWAASTPRWRTRIVLLVVALVVLGGLIISRSRSQWISGVFGLVVAGVLAPSSIRNRLVPIVAFGSVGGAGLGILFLGERLALFGMGLLTRLLSISSSFTQDISLLNRYLETDAGWKSFLGSPVFGNGWGSPITRFDVIGQGTLTWSFLHNGYVWILQKAGIIGLVLLMTAIIGVIVQAALIARSKAVPTLNRGLAAAGAGTLAAYLLLALPANPFVILDQMLIVTLVLALASGTVTRAKLLANEAPDGVGTSAP